MVDWRELEEIEALLESPRSRPRKAGPGIWRGNIHGGSGSDADRRYQRQITGQPTWYDYHVQRGRIGADFDGYRHGALLDAKNLPPQGMVVRMWNWMNQNSMNQRQAPPPEKLRRWANSQLSEARRQLHVAAKTPVEWHVSSRGGARVLRQLLGANSLLRARGQRGIAVVTTPPRRPRPNR